jgi:hypothetical protein
MKKRTLSIWDDPKTLAAQTLAYEGLSLDVICKSVGLTTGQLNYRLRRLGVSVTEYRQGRSILARERICEVLDKHRLQGRVTSRRLLPH